MPNLPFPRDSSLPQGGVEQKKHQLQEAKGSYAVLDNELAVFCLQAREARRRGWRGWLPSWGSSQRYSADVDKANGSTGSGNGRKSRSSRSISAAADAAVAAVDGEALGRKQSAAEPIDVVSGHAFSLGYHAKVLVRGSDLVPAGSALLIAV